MDTVPYFLGAVDEEHLYKKKELEQAARVLRELEARRNAAGSDDERTFGRIRRLIREARRVGLISGEFEPLDAESGREELRRAMTVDLRSPTIIGRTSEVIRELERMAGSLQRQLDDVQMRSEPRSTSCATRRGILRKSRSNECD